MKLAVWKTVHYYLALGYLQVLRNGPGRLDKYWEGELEKAGERTEGGREGGGGKEGRSKEGLGTGGGREPHLTAKFNWL